MLTSKFPKEGARFFLIGYYGFGNAGDEILQRKSIALIRQHHPTSALYILGNPPPAKDPLHWDDMLMWIPRKKPFLLLKKFSGCQSIVFGGGSLFQDASSISSLLYYCIFLVLAGLTQKECILLAQGFAPFKHKLSSFIFRLCLPRNTQLSVRDKGSAQALVQLGIPEDKIIVASDLAYMNSVYTRTPLPEQVNSVGISVRPFLLPHKKKAALLSHLLLTLTEDKVLLYLQSQEDQNTATTLKLKNKETEEWLLQDYWESPTALPQSIQLVLGMRYHACVWASLRGLPFLALSYDEKVTQLAEQLGQEFIPLHDLTEELFQTKIKRIKQNLDYYQSQLNLRVPDMLRKVNLHHSLIK